jgi:hypothetical protein
VVRQGYERSSQNLDHSGILCVATTQIHIRGSDVPPAIVFGTLQLLSLHEITTDLREVANPQIGEAVKGECTYFAPLLRSDEYSQELLCMETMTFLQFANLV